MGQEREREQKQLEQLGLIFPELKAGLVILINICVQTDLLPQLPVVVRSVVTGFVMDIRIASVPSWVVSVAPRP